MKGYLPSNKASALGIIECVNLLMGRVRALWVDSMVTRDQEVKASATQNGLKMSNKVEFGVRSGNCQTRETEALSQAKYEVRWRTEFYEAVNMIHSELSRRFDQDGMTVTVLREKAVLNAVCSTGRAVSLCPHAV